MVNNIGASKNLPEKWKIKKLGEVADVIDPQPDHRAPKEVPNGYPYVGVGDFNNDGTINFEKTRKVVEEAIIKQESSFKIDQNDIAFGKVGTIGNPRYLSYDKRYALSATLVLIKSKEVFNSYLYYFLQSQQLMDQIKRLTTGSTRPTIGILKLRELDIVIPSEKEQQKISAILTSVDDTIQKTEKIIEQTEKVKKGLMQQLLTKGIGHTKFKKTEIGEIPEEWEVRRLEDIISSTKLGTNDTANGNMGLPLIKMGNLTFGGFNFSKIEYINAIPQQYESFLLKDGDFLFNTRNTPELVGKTAIWHNQLEKAIYNNNILRIVFNKEIISSSDYVAYQFNEGLLKGKIRGLVNGTTSVAAIYWKDLSKVRVPIPNLNEQQKISEILGSLEEKIQIETNRKENLSKIKNGLMQVLLSGKVRVKVDEEEVTTS
ncbi:restriction endonuclease subunit S [Niallia endozanthoxylica]|uniref:Type I restriction modification DNA specificity domain-containing protein n=1 Tax=Niallia endozanthoxylica TaxID=2036016 RepID=A0A5J5HTA3_9BACI|nr:restriction endonuclease subunit S [Niallia endozanthoxylica]KAA9023566.1 hypothetical protein F4V44_12935 [Niallia endozanthoxylica]